MAATFMNSVTLPADGIIDRLGSEVRTADTDHNHKRQELADDRFLAKPEPVNASALSNGIQHMNLL